MFVPKMIYVVWPPDALEGHVNAIVPAGKTRVSVVQAGSGTSGQTSYKVQMKPSVVESARLKGMHKTRQFHSIF